jgi:hypothetical protein
MAALRREGLSCQIEAKERAVHWLTKLCERKHILRNCNGGTLAEAEDDRSIVRVAEIPASAEGLGVGRNHLVVGPLRMGLYVKNADNLP